MGDLIIGKNCPKTFPSVSRGGRDNTQLQEKGNIYYLFFLFTLMYSFFCLALSFAVYDLLSPLSFIHPPNLYYSEGNSDGLGRKAFNLVVNS